MMRHTPGPWVAEPEQASKGRGIAICAPESDEILATITPAENRPADARDWANARLIAKAPRLLNFVSLVAGLTKDGEIVEGREWVMPIGDCYVTLNRLINEARALLKP